MTLFLSLTRPATCGAIFTWTNCFLNPLQQKRTKYNNNYVITHNSQSKPRTPPHTQFFCFELYEDLVNREKIKEATIFENKCTEKVK